MWYLELHSLSGQQWQLALGSALCFGTVSLATQPSADGGHQSAPGPALKDTGLVS